MKQNSICIRCGTFKANFQAQCPSCNFVPIDDVDIAKSRILGPPYSFTLGERGATIDTGRSRSELKEISIAIRAGNSHEFPEAEVAGVLEAYLATKYTTRQKFLRTMLPLYVGLVIALGGLGYVIYSWPH